MLDKKSDKERLTLRVSLPLSKRFRHWCVDQGITLSEGVERALVVLMGAA